MTAFRIDIRRTDRLFPADEPCTDECSRCDRQIAEACVPLMLWNQRGDMYRFHPCCIGMTPCCIDELEAGDPIDAGD